MTEPIRIILVPAEGSLVLLETSTSRPYMHEKLTSPYQAKLTRTRANLKPREVADGDFYWIYHYHVPIYIHVFDKVSIN